MKLEIRRWLLYSEMQIRRANMHIDLYEALLEAHSIMHVDLSQVKNNIKRWKTYKNSFENPKIIKL